MIDFGPGLNYFWSSSEQFISEVAGRAMPAYRVYAVDPNGHVLAPPRVVEAADDLEAVRTAKQYLDGANIEVWKDSQRITTLKGSGPTLAKWPT